MKTLILILAAFVLSSIAYSEVEDCLCIPRINPHYPFEDSVMMHQDTILYFDTCGTEFSRSYRSCDSIFWYSYNYNADGKENLYAFGPWNISFLEKVVDIQPYYNDTLIYAKWQEIDTAYPVIRQHFREIEEWYGSYYMLKQNNEQIEPLAGQDFLMAFDSTIVKIELINQKLDSIQEYYLSNYGKMIYVGGFRAYPGGTGNSSAGDDSCLVEPLNGVPENYTYFEEYLEELDYNQNPDTLMLDTCASVPGNWVFYGRYFACNFTMNIFPRDSIYSNEHEGGIIYTLDDLPPQYQYLYNELDSIRIMLGDFYFHERYPFSEDTTELEPWRGMMLIFSEYLPVDTVLAKLTDYSVIESIEYQKLSGTTGIDYEVYCDTEYTIYPNPVSDKLIIKSKEALTKLIIRDVSGKVLKYLYTPLGNEINVQDLPAGAYFLFVNDKYTQKFIKK